MAVYSLNGCTDWSFDADGWIVSSTPRGFQLVHILLFVHSGLMEASSCSGLKQPLSLLYSSRDFKHQ
jgi:hypothetical protein